MYSEPWGGIMIVDSKIQLKVLENFSHLQDFVRWVWSLKW